MRLLSEELLVKESHEWEFVKVKTVRLLMKKLFVIVALGLLM
jgi:hypothetical protein